MNRESIKRILETSDGQALKKFLEAKVVSLSFIGDIKSDASNEIAVKVLGRNYAKKKLEEILKDFELVTNVFEEDEENEFGVE